MSMRITIKDIASASGMSLGTVSGVLNGGRGFSEDTRRKIWEIANSLNYAPSESARSLRMGCGHEQRGNSGIIIHITHIAGSPPTESLFEARRSQLIAWSAKQIGLYPITYWYCESEGFQCPLVLNGYVNGALVGTPDLDVVNALREKVPFVLMDVPFTGAISDIPMINIDMRLGFMNLMGILREKGHRSIGTLVAEQIDNRMANETIFHNELLSAARLAGISVPSSCDLRLQITPATHEQKMAEVAAHFKQQINQKNVSAIICPTHTYAKSLLNCFMQMGVNVPDDVSLVGVDSNDGLPEHETTSILYDWPAMIRASLNVLKDLIGGHKTDCREFLIRPRYHEGNTLGRAEVR